MPEEEMRENWEEYSDTAMEKYSPNNYTPLETGDMPLYRPPRKAFIPSVSIVDLLFLLVMNIILFITGGFLFVHSEVRVRV